MFDLAVLWLKRLAAIVLVVLALLAAVALFIGARADDRVDALVITGLDVSSSINAEETAIQINGTAEALRSPVVLAAIQNGKLGRIGVLVFLWADGTYPEVLAWRVIATQTDADAAAGEVAGNLKAILATQAKAVGTLTNLSGAMDHALVLLNAAPFRAERRLVNIVGNGEDNVGEAPLQARANLIAAGATINGVVTGGDPAVRVYYRANVIGGKGAFVRAAAAPSDIVGVMISKFVSEIAMVTP
jgi:hypothetical protein